MTQQYEYDENFKNAVKKLFPSREMAILLENGEPRVGFILEMAYLRGFTFIDFDSVKTQEDIKKAQKLIKINV